MSQSNYRPGSAPQRPTARYTGGSAARQPANNRQRRPAPRSGNFLSGLLRWLRSDLGKLIIGGAIAITAAFFLQIFLPSGIVFTSQTHTNAAVTAISEIYSQGPLRINEIMTSNRDTLTEEDGSSPDWIEIANIGDKTVSLEGYSLAKTMDATQVFTFPAVSLEPGQFLVVEADSRLRTDSPAALHAPFRLSSSGDTLMLFNAGGTAVDTVNIPALNSDQSYARRDRALWESSSLPTPGTANTEEGYRALTEPDGNTPVILTEIMAVNAAAHRDENGEYYDYIELYNRSSEPVDMTGWYLSDDVFAPRMWSLPELTLQPGERLIVFASALDRKEDPAHLHANFALNSERETVVLADPAGRVMDKTSYDVLKADSVWQRGEDGTWSVSYTPTPGN